MCEMVVQVVRGPFTKISGSQCPVVMVGISHTRREDEKIQLQFYYPFAVEQIRLDKRGDRCVDLEEDQWQLSLNKTPFWIGC